MNKKATKSIFEVLTFIISSRLNRVTLMRVICMSRVKTVSPSKQRFM